jgi:hypothetical protein
MVGGSTTAIAHGLNIAEASATSIDIGVPLSRAGTSADRCHTFNVDNVNLLYAAARASSDVIMVTYTEYE